MARSVAIDHEEQTLFVKLVHVVSQSLHGLLPLLKGQGTREVAIEGTEDLRSASHALRLNGIDAVRDNEDLLTRVGQVVLECRTSPLSRDANHSTRLRRVARHSSGNTSRHARLGVSGLRRVSRHSRLRSGSDGSLLNVTRLAGLRISARLAGLRISTRHARLTGVRLTRDLTGVSARLSGHLHGVRVAGVITRLIGIHDCVVVVRKVDKMILVARI